MDKETEKLSPAQFEIINTVWSQKDAMTITDVMNEINDKREIPLKRSAIQAQIQGLIEKEWMFTRKVGGRILCFPK